MTSTGESTSLLKRYRTILVVAILGSACAFGAYRFTRPGRVRAARAYRGTAVEAVYATGRVEARHRIEVKARVAGPLTQLRVSAGDTVHEDDVIAHIDAPTLGFEADRGAAALRAARRRADTSPQISVLAAQRRALESDLVLTRANIRQMEGLVHSGTLPASELEQQRQRQAEIEGQIAANDAQQRDVSIALSADLAAQRAEVASLQARSQDSEVRAPMDGVVLEVHVERGEVVAPNQDILRIGDVSQLQVEALVDESDISRIRIGSSAVVTIYARRNAPAHAHVARIAPDADRQRNGYRIALEFDEPMRDLRCGLTAEINIIVQEHASALLVPAETVRDGVVWLVDSTGHLHRRAVTVGLRDLARVEILSGVRDGDTLVTDPGSVVLGENRGVTVALDRNRSGNGGDRRP